MPIASKMRTLGDAGLYKYKWCNNLREVEQVNIFFLKDIADTIGYFVGNNIGFLYHNESKLFVCVPDNSIANVQHAVSQLFNSNIDVEYQNNTNLVEVLSAELSTLLGEGNYSIAFDNEERLITIDIPFAMSLNLEDVKKILNRAYLMNINIELLVDGVPAVYTHLEYLECSGTQYIRPGLVAQGLSVLTENIVTTKNNSRILGLETNRSPQDQLFIQHGVNNYGTGIGIYLCLSGTVSSVGFYDRVPETKWLAEVNWLEGYISCSANDKTQKKNVDFSTGFDVKTAEVLLFARNMSVKPGEALGVFRDYRYIGKCCYLKAWYEKGVLFRDFVPVLDANGTPCIYDKVSNQCLYNLGTGTFGYRLKVLEDSSTSFSLRDPHYTAPSGIWAKLIAENELDIIADTDIKDGEEQGYIWFANTGEAYEHFDIKEKSAQASRSSAQ